jgi:ribosomal protein S21
LAEVRLQDGETVENALRRFKRQVIQENIIGEVKRHSFYLKPGQKLGSSRHWPANATGKRLAGSLSRGRERSPRARRSAGELRRRATATIWEAGEFGVHGGVRQDQSPNRAYCCALRG